MYASKSLLEDDDGRWVYRAQSKLDPGEVIFISRLVWVTVVNNNKKKHIEKSKLCFSNLVVDQNTYTNLLKQILQYLLILTRIMRETYMSKKIRKLLIYFVPNQLIDGLVDSGFWTWLYREPYANIYQYFLNNNKNIIIWYFHNWSSLLDYPVTKKKSLKSVRASHLLIVHLLYKNFRWKFWHFVSWL